MATRNATTLFDCTCTTETLSNANNFKLVIKSRNCTKLEEGFLWSFYNPAKCRINCALGAVEGTNRTIADLLIPYLYLPCSRLRSAFLNLEP